MLPEDNRNRVWRNATTPGWFETMGIPLRSGRDFNDGDRVSSPPVAIVNEAFVRRYLSGQQPIGQTLRVESDDGPRYEIVGVVADAIYTAPRDGMLPTMYEPLAQREPREWNSWRDAVLTIKAVPGQRALVERDVATALTQADPTLVFTSGTFDQMLDATMTQERLIAMMSGFFGALALLLAGLGLYGIVAQAVGARRTEIGLRMALGAQPTGIVRLVFRRVGVLIVTGLALGLAGSWWAARFIAPLLFQVEARDPMTFSVHGRCPGCRGRAGCVGACKARSEARPGDRSARGIEFLRRIGSRGLPRELARTLAIVSEGCLLIGSSVRLISPSGPASPKLVGERRGEQGVARGVPPPGIFPADLDGRFPNHVLHRFRAVTPAGSVISERRIRAAPSAAR